MDKTFFKTRDGLKLAGVLHKSDKKNKACIILCHGFRSDKNEGGAFAFLSDKLMEKGFDVFRFDFRAHGESEGKSIDFTIKGQEIDLESVVDLLKSMGYKKFGIISASFSSVASLTFTVKNQKEIGAFVLWYPRLSFTDFRLLRLNPIVWSALNTRGFVSYKGFRMSRLLFDEFSHVKILELLKKLSIPVLFVHGNRDTRCPYKYSLKYSKLLGYELVTVEHARHGFSQNKKELYEAVNKTVKFVSNDFRFTV